MSARRTAPQLVPRALAALGLVVVGLLSACSDDSDAQTAAANVTNASEAFANRTSEGRSAAEWAADKRLAPILVSCFGKGHFDGDTSNMLPVLIAKLQSAPVEVLRNVREELAGLGEPAIVELDSLVRRLYSERHGSPTILNALGVIQLSPAGSGERAQRLLRHCLGHPQDTIRNAAIRALAKHANPAAYDDLLAIMRATQDTTTEISVTALYRADPKRLEAEVLGWMQSPERPYSNLIRHAVHLIAQGADADSAQKFAPLIAVAEDAPVRALLVSMRAQLPERGDDPFALLREMSKDSSPQTRMAALTALEFTDATDLITAVLTTDSDENLRLMASGLLATRSEEKTSRDALYSALNDSSHAVREAALAVLLKCGDERAVDTTLDLLAGSRNEVGIATRALSGTWSANPGLAERAFDLLKERIDARAAEPLTQREFLFQSLAQIPGPASTQFLFDLALTLDEVIDNLPAQRWLLLQASNTGATGVQWMRERWALETDLSLRFDLLWSASLGHDDDTREFLLSVLDAERSAGYERLYAAERLASEGPASVVAPRIKRANLRMSDEVFRPAMECLLWRWYG